MKVIILFSLMTTGLGLQMFSVTPTYREVNPGGTVLMNCVVESMKGECRWEKDGVPIGLYPGKYEMVGEKDGDCTLRILAASMEFDNGVWQCQVTASDFKQKDTLISDGAQLVVRVAPESVEIRTREPGYSSLHQDAEQDEKESPETISGRAGDELNLECVSVGGNPAPTLYWYIGDKIMPSKQTQENLKSDSGSWKSVSRLNLPVSRDDNLAKVRCEASHDALEANLETSRTLDIMYPPRATASTTATGVLAEGSTVVFSCSAESNPAASISWRRAGGPVLTTESSFTIQSVSRDSAGRYECIAENILGLSKPSSVDIQVQYAPVIVNVGPKTTVESRTGEKITLSCRAQGAPKPNYQWLQQLPTGEVLVRGYESDLVIPSVSYDHQGEFVCGAKNSIGEVQSDPIRVEVRGAPTVSRLTVASEVVVRTGEDANLEVAFCSNPEPTQTWNLGPVGGQNTNIVLTSNQRHGRFVVDNLTPVLAKDCYIAVLRILGAHPSDSRDYILELKNDHGIDTHPVKLVVIDTQVSQEIFIAIVVGGILTVLLLSLIIIYLVKADKCCRTEKNEKQEAGSDRTDVESCHSSVSNHSHNTVLPPDALYGIVDKKRKINPDHIFNDSNEKLRPDLLPNLSRSGSPNPNLVENKTNYNDLCFPKTSNCGSMKRKKQRNQGVDCQLTNNTYGYINYLNSENAANNFVSNKIYE